MFIYNEHVVEDEKVHINAEDRGYQFGDGVYEVIRFYNNQAFMLHEHLERLERSSSEIRLEWPCSREKLLHNIKTLISEHPEEEGMVYLQITRGIAPRNHLFPKGSQSVLTGFSRTLQRPVENMEKGIKAKLLDDIRWLRCDIKSLNLLGNVLLKQEAHEMDYQEAILHRDGTVTEGSSTNVFIVKNDALITHPANHLILNGITRQKIITLAKEELGINVIEQPFHIDDLMDADEVLISSTTMEIVPVVQIDGTQIGDGRGEMTRKIQDVFKKSIEFLNV